MVRESPSRGRNSPHVAGFYHTKTGSISYIVWDPVTRMAAIVDPVLDFDEKCGTITGAFADNLLNFAQERGLQLTWILDTHPHADHFSAASYLKRITAVPMAIGRRVIDIQTTWKHIYAMPEFKNDGSQWDRLFDDNDEFKIGTLIARVVDSPGHTLASITYVIGDAAFTHDTLFMPDSGSARCDFPGGDARALYRTIQTILSFPDDTRLFAGHDYRPNGRAALWESTPVIQRAENRHAHRSLSEQDFISLRTNRDSTLPLPGLMLFALQVNIQGGKLPTSDQLGRAFLKFPIHDLTYRATEEP
ncbi:MBL fold metallo-hydrolase [Afipia sp. Root123D2]|nr:MBL fold metallo-hydrolase [Afipia sp. Root123D2]